MYHWVTQFVTTRPVRGLPELILAGCETQNRPAYHFAGRDRSEHPFFCFQYTLGGAGMFRNACGTFRVPAGSGFLMEVADPAVEYGYPPDETDPWRFIYVEFMGGNVRETVREYLDAYGPIFRLPLDAAVIRRILGFGQGMITTRSIDAIIGARVVTELLMALGRSARRDQENRSHSELIRRALAIIRSNLGAPINATRLARRLNVSREHLSRVFRKELHRSPYAFILHQRLRMACHLLQTTDKTHIEIARETGFGSEVHFAQIFKKKLKMTPKEFRRGRRSAGRVIVLERSAD